MVRGRSTRSKKFRVDLSDFDPDGPDFGGGGGGFHIPDGEYPIKCVSVERKLSKNDSDMFEWKFEGTKGKAKGKVFYYYTVIEGKEQQQKLGKTLMALGLDFEPGDVEFEPDDVLDAECMGEVATDTYQGEKRSKLQRVFGEGEEAEEEEEETRSTRKKSSANGKSRRPIKVSEDEVKEMNEEELEELVEKHELDVDLSKLKTLARKSKAMIEALADKDLIA